VKHIQLFKKSENDQIKEKMKEIFSLGRDKKPSNKIEAE